MDGAKKTAVLLLSLEQEVAAILLRKLPRDQVERVTLCIANSERVTREEQESILKEFKSEFASQPLVHSAGPTTARQLLEKTLDQNDVEPLQARIEEQLHAGPFAFLHRRHANDIRRLIENEHPQTIAVVANQLPPDLSAQVLSGFPADVQTDVLGRVARLGPASSVVLDEIASFLRDRIGPVPVRTASVRHAGDVLRETPRSLAQQILESIEQSDAPLSESLRESMFPFDDIEAFGDAGLRVILQKTDSSQWALALKGASNSLRQQILRLMSAQDASAVFQELNSAGPVSLGEITEAQQQIVDAILSLELNRELSLPRNSNRLQRLRREISETQPKAAMP